MLENLGSTHHNLMASLVANELYIKINEKDIEFSSIMNAIIRQFQYNISYQKAWRAKKIDV